MCPKYPETCTLLTSLYLYVEAFIYATSVSFQNPCDSSLPDLLLVLSLALCIFHADIFQAVVRIFKMQT